MLLVSAAAPPSPSSLEALFPDNKTYIGVIRQIILQEDDVFFIYGARQHIHRLVKSL